MERKNPFESNNGLRVIDRTSQSISLEWPALNTFLINQSSNEEIEFGDEPEVESNRETDLREESRAQRVHRDGNWFEIEMRKEQTTNWTWVYKGYGSQCKIDGLAPDVALVFRMKRNNETVWGSEIVASTAPSPPSTEDLSRAVEMNSEILVSRILKLTRPLHLKKILLARDRNGMTPLMVACHIGNAGIAEKLISAGSDINAASNGAWRTSLIFACIAGHQNVVALLDQNKADWRLRDRCGSSGMDYAIIGGHLGILKLAISRLGAKCVHQKDDRYGWTSLLRAAILSDNLDVLRFLVNKGANPNSTDHSRNKSVLLSAIIRKKTNFVKYLLEKGADPYFQNQNGKNCQEMARILGYREITEILSEHMNALESKLP